MVAGGSGHVAPTPPSMSTAPAHPIAHQNLNSRSSPWAAQGSKDQEINQTTSARVVNTWDNSVLWGCHSRKKQIGLHLQLHVDACSIARQASLQEYVGCSFTILYLQNKARCEIKTRRGCSKKKMDLMMFICCIMFVNHPAEFENLIHVRDRRDLVKYWETISTRGI